MIDPTARIHPSAICDEGATIGARTRVWHFVHVSAGALVGADCVIGQGCYLAPSARMGDGVRLQNHVSVYDGVTLEDGVFCGPSLVFTNVSHPRAHVSRKAAFEPTRVRRGASLGANATVVCGTTVGRYAFVGAGAVVTRDVPDFALVLGVPARHVGWVCACGESLAGGLDAPAAPPRRLSCARCGSAYLEENGTLREAP